PFIMLENCEISSLTFYLGYGGSGMEMDLYPWDLEGCCRLAMSSNDAHSAVTYTSISSDSDGPSWGIPLINADELLKIDPYKEVTQQGQVPPLSPAYMFDPMELDEHVPVYIPDPEHPAYHAPSDDDIQEEELSEGFDKTEPFEEDETAVTPPPPRHCHRIAMIRMRDDIPEEDMPPWRRFVFTAPLPGCDVEESSAAAARSPRGQYDFVYSVEVGQGLIRSLDHDVRTIARAADKAEDVGYARTLQASEHMMMTSIKEVNLRISYQAQVRRQESKYFNTQLHDAQTDRIDIRLEINVVRGQRTAYETELQELIDSRTRIMHVTRQGTNDAMTPESIQAMIDREIQRNSTHTQDDASQSSGGGLRRPVQPSRVCYYTDFMKCQPLNFKGTKGFVGLSQWLEKMESVFHISGCAVDN
nr:reverse transcriptase domain-containing protein [Tanacetum cinerariifolium]GEZ66328.1 reverse transcriptase domain-containing protein [Tanacetum cinerariifolium]